VLIIGSNTAESHPGAGHSRKNALTSLHGQKAYRFRIWREHEMAKRADLFLHPKPGTDIVWLSAVSSYLLENGMAKHQVSGSMGEWTRRIQKEPRAVHDGVLPPGLAASPRTF